MDLQFVLTIVYAKYDRNQILELWDDIFSVANRISGPWIMGGDFNTIINESIKIWGLPIS